MNSVQLIAMAGVSSFSRENEHEADALGLRFMADAGYDPYAAPSIWRRFIDIDKVGGEEKEYDFFLSTHPPDDEREKKLKAQADERGKPRQAPPDRLRQALIPIRPLLLEDEVNRGQFKRTMKLFDILLADDPAPGQILYYKGELHRRRAAEGDEARALGYYYDACEATGAPPEAYRMVGLIRWRRGEKGPAREYFRRYLDKAPDATDGEMIKFYLAGA